MKANLTFTVHGRDIDELEANAERVLAGFAPRTFRYTYRARPLMMHGASDVPSFWEADVDADEFDG